MQHCIKLYFEPDAILCKIIHMLEQQATHIIVNWHRIHKQHLVSSGEL